MDNQLYIVSTEQGTRNMVSSVGHDCGYRVIELSTPQEAISAFTEQQPHVVVIDQDLPNVNEVAILHSLCSTEYCAQIIMLADPSKSKQCCPSNSKRNDLCTIKNYIDKPINSNQLFDILNGLQQHAQHLTETDLIRALAAQEFTLFYQPKVCLETMQVIGAECLVRWQHPKYGLLGPLQFLPLAENTGHMDLLNQWIIKSAFKQLKRWQSSKCSLDLSINFPQCAVGNQHLPEYMHCLAQRYHVNAENIIVEVPEPELAQHQPWLQNLEALRKHGFKISIDNFSFKGFTLSELKDFPIDELKIEKNIIFNLYNKAENIQVCKSIIELGHTLGLSVCAVGLECSESWNQLTALGCDTGQGFYISRPVSAVDFNRWFRA